MDSHPDPVLFICKNVNVMISTAHGPQLVGAGAFQFGHRFQLPRRVVEQFMFYPHLAFLTDTEWDIPNDIVHHLLDPGTDIIPFCIGQNSQVAARDVEADTAERNFVLVGNYSANWLSVTLVPI